MSWQELLLRVTIYYLAACGAFTLVFLAVALRCSRRPR